MKEHLFQEFEEVSAKQWKQKIQYELGGEDYTQQLIFHAPDGIAIKPFYSPEDLPEQTTPYSSTDWKICERIYATSAEAANEKARKALEDGAESLWLELPNEAIAPDRLLRNIPLDQTPVYLKPKFLSLDYFKRLRSLVDGKDQQLFLQTDIIGKLARSGNWFYNLEEDHRILREMLEGSKGFSSVLSINLSLYQNAGANIPQQLAYAMAHVNEFLHMVELLPEKERIGQQLNPQFIVSTGPNYFFEIAKIRALRWLYASLVKEYAFSERCHILAQPSRRNKTIYDYHVNLLRSTTESMSAILGGADTVHNLPYDAVFHKNNDFGERLARNQLLILKNEAFLGKVRNPAQGTFYIESLTRQLAEKALKLFKEIEIGGGFLRQLKQGIIQKKIRESAQKEQKEFDLGRLVLIGTNQYQHPEDRMKQELELFPFLKKKPRKTLLEPILERRLSEKTEQQRLEKESTEH